VKSRSASSARPRSSAPAMNMSGRPAQQLPYVHTYTDKLGWCKEVGDKLDPKADPLAEERRAFWNRIGTLPSGQEISELEALHEWLLAVGNEKERRASSPGPDPRSAASHSAAGASRWRASTRTPDGIEKTGLCSKSRSFSPAGPRRIAKAPKSGCCIMKSGMFRLRSRKMRANGTA
jgi:hypothetical protein